ncbi:hypothetical protein M5689_013082 [Euphorbia peplus]|nr:hypothetical protein M5689_013082 [Euphorbia peplus]
MLEEINNKLDDQHGRIFAMHNNQRHLLASNEDLSADIQIVKVETMNLTSAVETIPDIKMVVYFEPEDEPEDQPAAPVVPSQ